MSESVDRRVLLGVAGMAGAAAISRLVRAGPIDPPPGPIAPTPGPEPRTPVNSDTCPSDGGGIYTISQPGSYYLTGDVAANGSVSAINITTSDVTIDLNGFVLTGASKGPPGIYALAGVNNIRITNGTVRGFTNGIDLGGTASHIDRICAIGNTGTGIRVVSGELFNCRADSNSIGFDAANSVLVGCAANGNSLYGIQATLGSALHSCRASGGAAGITVSRATVIDCTVSASTLGIEVVIGVVLGSLATSCSTGFRIVQTTAKDCRAVGTIGTTGFLVQGAGSHVESCSAHDNSVGFNIPAAGNFIVRNVCGVFYASGYTIQPGGQAGIGIIVDARGANINNSNSYANWMV